MANNSIGRKAGFIPRKSYPQVNDGLLKSLFQKHGLPSDLSGPMSKVLKEILDKQAIDERINYTAIEDSLGGGGKEYATIVIAAADSTAHGKATADYVCDGVDDHIQFETAIQAVFDAGGRGVHIAALEGSFVFGNDGMVFNGFFADPHFRVLISGQGDATRFQPSSAAGLTDGIFVLNAEGFTFKDLMIDGSDPGNNEISVPHIKIDGNQFNHLYNVTFENGTTAIYTDVGYIGLRVVNCHFYNVTLPLALYGECNNTLIRGNYAEGIDTKFADIAATSLFDINYLTIVDNNVDGTIYLYQVFIATVNDNLLTQGDVRIVECRAIHATGNFCGIMEVTESVVVDIGPNTCNRLLLDGPTGANVIGGSYSEWGELISCTDCFVIGASFGSTQYEGTIGKHILTLDSTHESFVIGCRINAYGASIAAGTWAGILLTNNCDGNSIQGNFFRADSFASPTQPDYGVWLDNADCDNNRVVDNDFLNFYATAAIQDAGTGTITTSGNRG